MTSHITPNGNDDMGQYGVAAPVRSLPSSARLLMFAVLVPAFVAGSNQLLMELAPAFRGQSWWLCPWMALSTAVLSWCVGRYLYPAWLRWLVFGWCLVLLDFLTIAACMGWGVPYHFGYALVSAQIGLLLLWATLASVSWQWRLPTVLAAAPAVMIFSGSFDRSGDARNWNLMLVLTAIVVGLLCLLLRLLGFRLQPTSGDALTASDKASLGTSQFTIKHMLFWTTALVPLLLVARGINFVLMKKLGGPDLLPIASVALSIAAVNLLAIWVVLGRGFWLIRLAALVAIPLGLSYLLGSYLASVEASYQITWMGRSTGMPYISYNRGWYNSLVYGIADARDSLGIWLWLNAALLAAMLLFLHASGHRLMRKKS